MAAKVAIVMLKRKLYYSSFQFCHPFTLVLPKITRMKKGIILILICFICKAAIAQTDSSALYIQYPEIPPFSIMVAPDSTKFTKADLKKRKPALIIIFSPDCEHCQHETKDLLNNMELFKKLQIIMVSHLDFRSVKKFYVDYKIGDYPNITMGRDGAYMLGTFYKIHTFPTMFLYDKKGHFVKKFEGSIPVKKIAESL